MPRHPLLLVDAFTDRPLRGNACAVVLEADGMDAATMQAVAREMNLSETAFARRSTLADAAARYFTPAEEIPLAGHPTIATVFALAVTGRLPAAGRGGTVSLELRDGPIPVEVVAEGGTVRRIVMSQRKPIFGAAFAAAETMPIFGLQAGDALPGPPIQVVSTGTPQLMVPVRDHDALRRARLDPEAYLRFRRRAGFFSPHLFCLQGATPRGRTFARHLGVPPEPFEDPFTGSATGGMAAHLWHHRVLREPAFVAEQGHWMHRPGEATVEVVGPPDGILTVKVGGAAVVVLEGTLTI